MEKAGRPAYIPFAAARHLPLLGRPTGAGDGLPVSPTKMASLLRSVDAYGPRVSPPANTHRPYGAVLLLFACSAWHRQAAVLLRGPARVILTRRLAERLLRPQAAKLKTDVSAAALPAPEAAEGPSVVINTYSAAPTLRAPKAACRRGLNGRLAPRHGQTSAT